MSEPEDRLSTIDIVELSDLAWTILDPDGQHEDLEQAWTAGLPHEWPPPASVEELGARLRDTSDLLRPAGDGALLELVAAVITYLAAHPERRRVDEAVIGDALRERYVAGLPDEVARWLARRPSPAAHGRRHGARARRRHLHSRPPSPSDQG